ncbi:signal peptidase I [Pseudonocardia broussonetiae]|uniref:Signal peptidase I n=1 Tax=Pseudonocardia broussonetiae TaxID=2736640 RepID=A0A6M6JFK2_9PSEU|nr:signal peptidase I [Pseudonocardia broussonetiae]QJY46346.1 signal peptidase I [Pseudonocardia broussonetiae]
MVARRAWSALLALFVVAAVALALAVAAVPAVAGASTLTVLSGSMEPTLPVGSVVVVRPRPAGEVGVGDVVTFLARDPGSAETRVVTHRVVEVLDGPAFRTRGDANPDPDPGVVAAADLRGVEWYVVPWVGGAMAALRTPVGLLVGGGVLLLLLGAGLLLPAARPRADDRGARMAP